MATLSTCDEFIEFGNNLSVKNIFKTRGFLNNFCISRCVIGRFAKYRFGRFWLRLLEFDARTANSSRWWFLIQVSSSRF